jgi:hypothetical protein
MSSAEVAPLQLVASRILLIRQQKVLLDSDLAALYQAETGALNPLFGEISCGFPRILCSNSLLRS